MNKSSNLCLNPSLKSMWTFQLPAVLIFLNKWGESSRPRPLGDGELVLSERSLQRIYHSNYNSVLEKKEILPWPTREPILGNLTRLPTYIYHNWRGWGDRVRKSNQLKSRWWDFRNMVDILLRISQWSVFVMSVTREMTLSWGSYYQISR